ncbi:MAG: hypothetical protein ABI347_03575 [Nitrososphaera sp.]
MVEQHELAACGKCGCVYIPRIAEKPDGRRPCPACGFIGIHHQINGKLLEEM